MTESNHNTSNAGNRPSERPVQPNYGDRSLQNKPNSNMQTLLSEKLEELMIGLNDSLSDVDEMKETSLALIDALKNYQHKTDEYIQNLTTIEINKVEEKVTEYQTEAKKLFDSIKDENQKYQNELLKKISLLIDSNTQLSEKISIDSGYENYLEQKIKNSELSASVGMLEQQLKAEKVAVEEFLYKTEISFNKTCVSIDNKVREISAADKVFDRCIERFESKRSEELKSLSEQAATTLNDTVKKTDELLAETCKQLRDATTSEVTKYENIFSSKFSDYISKCQDFLDKSKKSSESFLHSCVDEYKRVVGSIESRNKEETKVSKNQHLRENITILAIVGNMVVNAIVLYMIFHG